MKKVAYLLFLLGLRLISKVYRMYLLGTYLQNEVALFDNAIIVGNTYLHVLINSFVYQSIRNTQLDAPH